MTQTPAVLDSALKYVDRHGNLLRNRTELCISQMLDFFKIKYTYTGEKDVQAADFETEHGDIVVIGAGSDISRYEALKKLRPERRVIAMGHSKYCARREELDDLIFHDQQSPQTGSIFIEDQSFTFDYAHILPLVEKCSILHGHTSSVMVELIGQMRDNLLLDFGEAKRLIKDAISEFDHKFFINRRYMKGGDDAHYEVSFEGPRGRFDLRVPRDTTYLLKGEATVENLSMELVRLLAPRLPGNIEAIGIYIYEGYNKGSHIISRIKE